VTPVNFDIASNVAGDRLGQRLQLFSGGNHGGSLVDEEDVDGPHDGDAVRAALGSKADELAESLA